MKKFLFVFALPLLMLSFAACSDDDDNTPPVGPNTPSRVPPALVNLFNQNYPDVTDVEWDSIPDYYIVDCDKNMRDIEVWYTRPLPKDADPWVMTETNVGKDFFLAPNGLNLAFAKSEYATMTVDDIINYEYADATRNVWVIEVDQTTGKDLAIVFDPVNYTIVNTLPAPDNVTPATIFK